MTGFFKGVNMSYSNEPEMLWCNCCGKDIWIIVTSQTKDDDLLCTTCKEFFDQYDGGINNDTDKETKNNV